jgi:uncharacterized membrane protein YphA (DoxX/SURF4 family)
VSARAAAAGIALSIWLLFFRAVAGLSCVVDAAFSLGLVWWAPANPERLMPMPLNFASALVQLLAGLLLAVGISTRFVVAVLAVQLAFGVGLEWLHTGAHPWEVPNFNWLAVTLAVLGAAGPGTFSVDAWKPRLLPKLLVRLREGS